MLWVLGFAVFCSGVWLGVRALERWAVRQAFVDDGTFTLLPGVGRSCSPAGVARRVNHVLARRRGHCIVTFPGRWGSSYLQFRQAADGRGWDCEYHRCSGGHAVWNHEACLQWRLHEDAREQPVDEEFVRNAVFGFLASGDVPAPFMKDVSWVLRAPPPPRNDDDGAAPPHGEPDTHPA